MKDKIFIPTRGAFVKNIQSGSLGVVIDHSENRSEKVKIHWPKEKEKTTWEYIHKLSNGLRVGMEILHVPDKKFTKSLGWGIVRQNRDVAGSEQVLIEFFETNNRVWLPWQHLRMVKSVKHRFLLNDHDGANGAERLRLRLLSWAIKLWDENTGALAELDIDPLPHQIHLVHHILASGNYNWLIADDVGLGKTIETGLLLHALRQRKEIRRVLLITPSGLTRQWKEEMYVKFSIDNFRIYGEEFSINEPRDWKLYDYVIASMDRVKINHHLESLLQAEEWDLIIVDEAHRFSRRQYGNKYDSSQRYEMLSLLRKKTENIILLTATPHQGREDSFVGLLEILRPERRNELLTLSINPEIINDMVFRNYKADVTDIEGNFIFHGKTVSQLMVPSSDEMQDFDKQLQEYLRLGYAAEAAIESNKGRAIGFVMTVYRKLAASSIEAIYQALKKRLNRLKGEVAQIKNINADDRYQGEQEEQKVFFIEEALPFFDGEINLLEILIEQANKIRGNDIKINLLMREVVEVILKSNVQEKILFFSEYRATQGWIENALSKKFDKNKIVLIHGGMSLEDRIKNIDSFKDKNGAQFLISTEAGGEGINLQERCHIMVNYDLPWNPMRIVQRIGRLYRYGQKRKVIVFNVHQKDSADDQIMNILYKRIDQVVINMSSLKNREFNDAMRDDVLGEISELIDIEDILEKAITSGVERTRERIDEAIQRARETATKQRDLFQYAAGFNERELDGELKLSISHVQSFVEGMCKISDIEILEKRHKELVWSLRFPDFLAQELGVSRTRWDITFDRKYTTRRSDLQYMNPDNWLFKYWLDISSQYDFKGVCASLANLNNLALIAGIIRWQNIQGKRIRQELVIFDSHSNRANLNPRWVENWLLQAQLEDSKHFCDRHVAEKLFNTVEDAVNTIVRDKMSSNLLPEEPQWIAAGYGN